MPNGLQSRPQALVLSVSELAGVINTVLETTIDRAYVAGEICNLKMHASGHWYFSLKDARAQISAVMFRSRNQQLRFRPEDGMQVLVRGRIAIYETRGALQLYVDAMEPHGLGLQQLALEQLKARLLAEGLFDAARKRPLPYFPSCIGIVTAVGGAAIHDMLVTLRQRCPAVRVVIRPVAVQGRAAATEIVAALADFARFPAAEVVILGRGGGSAEDLAAFNEEAVARAVAASPVPVVSAVGHEIDVTLADLVADQRAATPTAAAALVVPELIELRQVVQRTATSLHVAWQRTLQRRRLDLATLQARLRDPRQTLRVMQQRVDELFDRLARAARQNVQGLQRHTAALAAHLDALSPLAVLARGYTIVRRVENDSVVRTARELVAGDSIELRFTDDRVRAIVLDAAIPKES